MTMGPNATWLEHFAARLLLADPTTTPLDAIRQAVESYDDAAGLDPGTAAEAFALRERYGRVNATQMRHDHRSRQD